MTLVGFKRAKIQVYDKDWKPVETPFVVQGDPDKGATTEASISGLSKEPVTVPGSNVNYYISRKGTGSIKIDFGLLDLPNDVSNALLGYKKGETSGITYVGEETEAPYCGVLLESENLQGEKVLFGFYKGIFSRDKVDLKTTDPTETTKPEADSWTFTAAASTQAGEINGNTVGIYIGSDTKAIAQMEHDVLGTALPSGSEA